MTFRGEGHPSSVGWVAPKEVVDAGPNDPRREKKRDESTKEELYAQLEREFGEEGLKRLERAFRISALDHNPIYDKATNIKTLQDHILSGSLSKGCIQMQLDFLQQVHGIKREEVFTPEFIAQLEAKNAVVQRTQLERLAILLALPAGYRCTIEEMRSLYFGGSMGRPLSQQVKDQTMDAIRQRLPILKPEDLARDSSLRYLLSVVGEHCGQEGRDFLRKLYKESPEDELRAILLRYATNTDFWLDRRSEAEIAMSNAEFLADVAATDPSETVRNTASFQLGELLAEVARKSQRDPAMKAISERFAGKKDALAEVLATHPKEPYSRIEILDPQVQADFEKLRHIMINDENPTARSIALAKVANSRRLSYEEVKRLCLERYGIEVEEDVRATCIECLGSVLLAIDGQELMEFLERTANGGEKESVRSAAKSALDYYKKELEDRKKSEDDWE